MMFSDHELIVIGAAALFAFIGARVGSRSKSDTAAIARLEQKINAIQSHLGLTGYDVAAPRTPVTVTPTAVLGSTSSMPVAEIIMDEIRRGRKIEAIRLYRAEYQVGLKEAKDAVDQLDQNRQ